MSKLESLTKAQEAEIPNFVRKYIQIGLATDPLPSDLELEGIFAKIYANAKLKAPKIIKLRSPLEGIVGSFYFLR